jgi:hypothetical protein
VVTPLFTVTRSAHALAEILRERPEPCFRALDAAHSIPWIEYESITAMDLDAAGLADGLDRGGEFPALLAWHAQISIPDEGVRGRFALLVDVLPRLDPLHVRTWPSTRARVRSIEGCPTWLVVVLPDLALLDSVQRAFTHEPTLLPIVMDGQGKLLAKPTRTPPVLPSPLLL